MPTKAVIIVFLPKLPFIMVISTYSSIHMGTFDARLSKKEST